MVQAEIIRYDKDNETSIAYNGGISNQTQYVPYEVKLESLIVPRKLIKYKLGGIINDYSHIYVRFGNSGNMSKDTLYTNNPSNRIRGSLFKVPIDNSDDNNFNFSTFKCDMTQLIKFRPADNMTFAIYMEDGTPLEFIDDDTVSPALPDQTIQVSAVFSVLPVT